MIYIGIDTGFAVWNTDTKCLFEDCTYTITQAIERVRILNDISGRGSVRLYVEDARQRKWFGRTSEQSRDAALLVFGR